MQGRGGGYAGTIQASVGEMGRWARGGGEGPGKESLAALAALTRGVLARVGTCSATTVSVVSSTCVYMCVCVCSPASLWMCACVRGVLPLLLSLTHKQAQRLEKGICVVSAACRHQAAVAVQAGTAAAGAGGTTQTGRAGTDAQAPQLFASSSCSSRPGCSTQSGSSCCRGRQGAASAARSTSSSSSKEACRRRQTQTAAAATTKAAAQTQQQSKPSLTSIFDLL